MGAGEAPMKAEEGRQNLSESKMDNNCELEH